ncbi:MAG: UDP-N-acetylmuramoyl-L-alanyl-D-glutamate--2,6-diaminopimelate ligase [Lachnospiraceae bacterium]
MAVREWLEKISYTLLQGNLDEEVTEVIYDSRKAAEHTVFVCMKGANADSHQFIPDVLLSGCKVLVVEHPVAVPEDVTVIQVENGRRALACLSAARFGYPAEKMVTIGVTGTKGKTTTTHMIKAILEACKKKVGIIGTTGVVIGHETWPTVNTTPESFAIQEAFDKMAKAGCEYAVMEVSSQGLKMHRVDGICFDYALFTNLSPDHIGPNEHETFEEYLYWKSQIFTMAKVGILNRDDSHSEEIRKYAACPVYEYSLKTSCDFFADNIRCVAEDGFVGTEFDIKGRYEADVKVGVPGRFNVYNALGAFAVASFLELPKNQAEQALKHLRVNGRMELVHSSPRCSVIVDYAHNAVSMESLLKTLREYHPKRLVCVFGCGGNRSKDRRYAMGEMGGRMADLCILTADNSRFEKTEDILSDIKSALIPTGGKYLEIPDRREAISYAITHAQEGDMIAVIGKGHEDYQEENGVRRPFLDRAVIEEVVQSCRS